MKVRFQADADLNEILVKAVLRREPGIDFQTARTAGLAGVPDKEVLAMAAGQAVCWLRTIEGPCRVISPNSLRVNPVPAC